MWFNGQTPIGQANGQFGGMNPMMGMQPNPQAAALQQMQQQMFQMQQQFSGMNPMFLGPSNMPMLGAMHGMMPGMGQGTGQQEQGDAPSAGSGSPRQLKRGRSAPSTHSHGMK